LASKGLSELVFVDIIRNGVRLMTGLEVPGEAAASDKILVPA
jgi:hypothetical protein